MKSAILLFFVFFLQFTIVFSQDKNSNPNTTPLIEDSHGHLIQGLEEQKAFLKNRELKRKKEYQDLKKTHQTSKSAITQQAVEMCTNGGFEQNETANGNSFIKNFLYTIGDPPGPTQCRSITNIADTPINSYDPNYTEIMATGVSANLVDPYLGDIKAFDQYALKINYENSSTYGSIVQGKRYKTNNENFLKFNYKAVLQSVYDNSHTDNQAFVKARILNKNGAVVNEFCLVGDEKNCIFTKVPSQDSSFVTLYTANWQSGYLDISSIPNNEEFTVEFMASRCGLGGHFGYMYVDDICLLRSEENLQGSVELAPLNKVCSTLPISVCGDYTLPNSGGISSTVKKITLNVYDSNAISIYSTSTTSSIDTTNKKFCFLLKASDFPNTTNANYNVSVQVDYDIQGTACSGTIFNSAKDPDANPGWDISFLNCNSNCDISVKTAKLTQCDSNRDGSENFDLSKLNSLIVNSTVGLSFSFFKNYNDAAANINAITNFTSYPTSSTSIFVRVNKNASCFKIISADLEVNNPTANITGILNVCSGSTVLKASSGSTYLWNTGEITQNITVTSIGDYSVTVTDSFGCSSTASVKIEPSQTALLPTLQVTQPSCLSTTGSIKVTSTAAEFSFDNGTTWIKNDTMNNLYPGVYLVKIKTVNGCISYSQSVTISAVPTLYPNYTSKNPLFCGDFGSITITTPSSYYSFDDGATWVNYATASNLLPGNYKIRIKDAQGCESSANNVVLSSISLELPTYTYIKPACNEKGNITITTVSDFYTFDGGATWGTNNQLNDVSPGNYSIGIKNKLGCTSNYDYLYLYDYQSSPIENTVYQPVCGSDGIITITTVADSYSFDDGATWTKSNTANLPPGNYLIKIKNSTGCISNSQYVYLYEPYLNSPFISVEQPTCGANGKITVNSLSDFYSFDNGVTWSTLNSKSLPAGYYSVIIKNSIGCKSMAYGVYLNNPYIADPTYTVVQPTCTTPGSIIINSTADSYSFDGGVTWGTNASLTNLTSYGYYNIITKNNIGCTSNTIYITIYDPNLPEPDYNYTNPSCGNIGNIVFNTSADYYSIDYGTNWSTNNVFTNLSAGYYGLVIKKADCLSKIVYISLEATTLAKPKYTVVQPLCGTKGSITFNTTADFYTIDGYNWVTNPIFINLTSQYYHPAIKNTQGCISAYNAIYIEPFNLPSPTYTVTQPTCGKGGSITFTTTASEYSIDGGTTWSTNPKFDNLIPKSYSPVIKNTLGCTSNPYSVPIQLNQYYLPNPDFTIIQPTCGSNGSITIATVADYYSFDGGTTWTTNPKITGLTSGYYYIAIKNTNGCQSNSLFLYITPYFLPNPNVKVIQPSCADGGSITITTPADSYSFDGGTTWSSNPVLLNPTSSAYNVVIKNTTGCISQSQYYYINKYFLPSPNITTIQPTCSSPLGTIIVNTSADQISFDNGITWTKDPVKKNVASGQYYIIIKNSSGCQSNSNYVYIYNPPYIPLGPTVKITQPSSCGATDGSITITNSGISYSFNDGNSWTNNPTKINLGAGTYFIKIKANNYDCESASTVVNLSSGSTIAAPTYTSTPPNCNTSKGSITITTNAATYSYDNGLTYVYSNTKTDLSPGTYYIKIKDLTGCISDAAKVIIPPLSPLAAPTYKITQPDCLNSKGSILIDTVADLYSFDNGLTFETLNTKSNLSPGTYSLMIKNNSGCISLSTPATIDTPPIVPVAPQVVITNPTDCKSSTGSITITTAANSYSFDDGNTWKTNNTAVLSPGKYSIRVKFNNSCASLAYTATINNPPDAPSIPTIKVSQPSSCSNPFGSIYVTSSAYQYSFNNGTNYTTDPNSGNLSPGKYEIKTKNNSGCESPSLLVTINAPTDYPKNPDYVTIQPDCNNPNGTITINENASEYSFDNGFTWTKKATQTNLNPKTYYLKVKNLIGCISEATTVTLIPFTNFTIKPSISTSPQTFCIQQNATLNSIAITGQNVKWYDALTNGNLLASNTSLQNGVTYYASQTLNGCESERTAVLINIQNTPTPITNTNQTFCSNQNPTIDTIQVTGTNIKWYDASNNGSSIAATTNLINGTTYYVTQTINNCESPRLGITVSIVNTPPNPIGNANQIFCKNENAKLSDIAISGQNIKWYDSTTSTITLANDKLLVNNSTYYASQTIGCESSRIPILIRIQDTPLPLGQNNQQFCIDDNPLLSDLTISGTAIKWYDAQVGGNLLLNTTPLLNGKTYFATQTINDCESERLAVTSIIQDSTPPTAEAIQSFCVQKNAKISDISILGQNINWFDSLTSSTSLSESTLLTNGTTYYASQTVNNCESTRIPILITILDATNNECINLVDELPYPKFFTPNNDGFNDTWTIDFNYLEPNSSIRIFDRYGKLVKELRNNDSWDGTYLGHVLPATDYWFTVTRKNGSEFKSHFSLKR
ncbi:T9SS type B sorting domain-containing protein [Flavobacterium sp. RSSB_23]|uniref:T9SS type B sorting domain-containing protein n=1 Tax=Flavobacterium sp. RSSB_23 TaxID=3447668 RepID=UPI003F319DE0